VRALSAAPTSGAGPRASDVPEGMAMPDEALGEQLAYYRARAPEYDAMLERPGHRHPDWERALAYNLPRMSRSAPPSWA
jgi:hypothetical protein